MQSNPHLKVLAFTNDTASSKWRFDGIADRMNETQDEMLAVPYKVWNGDIVGANIVVIEQLTSVEMVRMCHDQGAKVIFEADDAMLDSYGHERKNLQRVIGQFKSNAIDTIKMCDALTVTTEELKKNYARFTDKPIYVLPNYIDPTWYGTEPLHIQRNSPEIRLGWFGSKGHFEDLKWLLPTLGKLIEKYPNLKLVYCGYGGFSSDKLATEASWGEDVFSSIPRNRREFYLSVKPDLWPMKHKLLDLDIGIAPLIDDYFNRCKTPIKWMEYGNLRTPAVCSKVLYESVVTHGENGYLAETPEDWEKYLSMLIEDSKLRKTIGKAAQHTIQKKHNLDFHWTKWVDVYNEVLNS